MANLTMIQCELVERTFYVIRELQIPKIKSVI